MKDFLPPIINLVVGIMLSVILTVGLDVLTVNEIWFNGILVGMNLMTAIFGFVGAIKEMKRDRFRAKR